MASLLDFVTKEGKHFAPIVNEVPSGFRLATSDEIADATIRKYPGADGNSYVATTTKLQSGAKGVFAKVRLESSSTTESKLFAVNTQTFLSSN